MAKAVLMAGGCGTRGRPYTDYIPKVSIPVCGRPAISRIAGHLASFACISEIIVLADFEGLGGQIRNYFGSGKISGKRVRFVQDSQSGTGGDLLHLKPHITGNFVLWFADNMCGLDPGAMLSTLKDTKTLACVAGRSRRKEETGFARVRGKIIEEFVEKPTLTLPNMECVGIYALSKKIFPLISDAVRKKPNVNLSYDILAKSAPNGLVSFCEMGGLAWIDAESPAVLKRRAGTVRKAISQMRG